MWLLVFLLLRVFGGVVPGQRGFTDIDIVVSGVCCLGQLEFAEMNTFVFWCCARAMRVCRYEYWCYW